MTLSLLFVLHALATLAAGVVLIVAPAAIPRTVGIEIGPSAYLICYLLGACELGVGALSYGARKLREPKAVRLICASFIVLHLSTAAVEVYAYLQGLDPKIWANVALRVGVSALFARFGFKGR